MLATIGITKMLELPPNATPNQPTAMTGFGLAEVKPYFWLIDGGTVGTNMHVAFTVDTRDDVVTFHRAALETQAGRVPITAVAGRRLMCVVKPHRPRRPTPESRAGLDR